MFRLSRAGIKAMKRNGGGVIVNIGSDWALVGGRNAFAYCASKGAVAQMTRAMALDHARENIRVNCVCPGEIDTPMTADLISHRYRGLTPEQGPAARGMSCWQAPMPSARSVLTANSATQLRECRP